MLAHIEQLSDQAQNMGRDAAIKLIHDLVKENIETFESIAYKSFTETWYEETGKII